MTTVSPTPSGPHVRHARRDDLPAVHRIEQSTFPQPWPFVAFEQYVDRPGFLVADDGGIVGYVVADVVDAHGQPVGHIKDLAVRADRRREGIGTELLTRGMDVLAGQVETVKLEVRETNTAAIDLYRRHDFTYRRRLPEYYADGEDALVLVRSV